MRPKRTSLRAPSPFRYQGYVDPEHGPVHPHVECEEAGNHRVTPKVWPPTAPPSDPHLSARCELCGCWLIVTEKHAVNPDMGIDVVIPERSKK